MEECENVHVFFVCLFVCFFILSRGNAVKTCIFHWSLNIPHEQRLTTESQEFLRITLSSESDFLSSMCVYIYIYSNPTWEFSGLILPWQWSNPHAFWFWWFQKLQSLGFPSYFLVAHMSCQTFGPGSLVPGHRGESVLCLWGLQLGFEVLTHLITGKTSLSKGGKADGVLYLLPTPPWPDRQI